MNLIEAAGGESRSRIIIPLVRRHAEDAAFYWSQLDGAATSTRLRRASIERFHASLSIHLEGLEVAEEAGLPPALAALNRWMKPGEVFVAATQALACGDANGLDAVLALVAKWPDLLMRGLISALAYSPDKAEPFLATWARNGSDPVKQVAALRAFALNGGAGSLPEPWPYYLQHANPMVQSAACRASLRRAPNAAGQVHQLLRSLLGGSDASVRAEAAIALRVMERDGDAASALWTAVARQAASVVAASGWNLKQSSRRLNRWLRHLAWMVPAGHADLATLFQFLPLRSGLTFALYHGDCMHLPHVVACMREAHTARYAGWVWQTLTGISLAEHGLVRSADGQDEALLQRATEARFDAEEGLPLPDADAIAAHPLDLPLGQRTLLGQPLDEGFALNVVETDMSQAVRGIAAFSRLELESRASVRVDRLDSSVKPVHAIPVPVPLVWLEARA